MRPLLSPAHEADLRAETEANGAWESDNGRLLTTLAAERHARTVAEAWLAYRDAELIYCRMGDCREAERKLNAAHERLIDLGEKP